MVQKRKPNGVTAAYKKIEALEGLITNNQGPKLVVQNWISANPGLKFNPVFWFACFCMSACFKTLKKKVPILEIHACSTPSPLFPTIVSI